VEGWSIPEIPPVPELRNILTKWTEEIGADRLYEKLTILDPEAARVNDPQNVRRTIRALEVIFTTGVRFSTLRKREDSSFRFFVIGLSLERKQLYERIDARINQMINQGLVEEVGKLLSSGYTPDLSPMSAIGYREICEFLDGKITFQEAVALMKRNTRNFVRRQANWFKAGDPFIHWYAVLPDPTDAIIKDFNDWKEASLGI
jgi:tRNA dimethylallyltransferase